MNFYITSGPVRINPSLDLSKGNETTLDKRFPVAQQ